MHVYRLLTALSIIGMPLLPVGCSPEFDDCTATGTCPSGGRGSGEATSGSGGATSGSGGQTGGAGQGGGSGQLSAGTTGKGSSGAAGSTGGTVDAGGTSGRGSALAGDTSSSEGGRPASGAAGSEGNASGNNSGTNTEGGQGGNAGTDCFACGSGLRCDAETGECVCDATSCPEGCCNSAGHCITFEEQSDAECGGGGVGCEACAAGQSCDLDGSCACTAASCDGWCHDSTCIAFETIATAQPTFPGSHGIALMDSDVYWVSSSSSDQNADKYRVQRRVAGGSVETLLSNQPYMLSKILIGGQRVYVLNVYERTIQSMKPDGSDLRTDETYAYSLRLRNGRIYWHENWSGAINVNSKAENQPSDAVLEYTEEVEPSTLHITDIALDRSGRIAYGVLWNSGEHQIRILDRQTSSDVFPRASGYLERLETDDRDGFYWLVRDLSAGLVVNLFARDGTAPSPTQVTQNLTVVDFAVVPSSGGRLLYYSYRDPDTGGTGLRLYDTELATTFDILNDNWIGSLTMDDTHLYFFERVGQRLVRIPLPHVVLDP